MGGGQGHVGELLHASHLLLDRNVSTLLFKLHHAASAAPHPSQLDEMTPPQLRAVPRWIAALPIEPAQKIHKLALLTDVADAPARLAALRQLLILARDPRASGCRSVIAEFCHDPDPLLARIALRYLVGCKSDGLVALLLKLVNSEHAEIRALAADELAPLGFDRLWSAWPRLSPARQLAAGRALIKIDPAFHRTLGKKLESDDRESRMRALMIIFRLNQGAFFVDALKVLINDSDQRVASAAARALGTADRDAAAGALQDALDHPDSRVRANAIEALYELDAADCIDKLSDMARDEDNRPRANAIGVLMEMNVAEAMDALNHMVHDERPEQRVSALWLIQRMDIVDVAEHVAEMSLADPDPDVRKRATRVIEHLIAALEHDQAPTQTADAAGPQGAKT